jgi:putative hemolysin
MLSLDQPFATITDVLLVFFLVFANGFFVAAEFSLVAMRRSRVVKLVAQGRANAGALQHAVDHLDVNLAATQLGITISSLALGWIGEPVLAHLIEPVLAWLPGDLAATWSHVVAIMIAFMVITMLHIVLGELAPKSLALQRSEKKPPC